METSNRGSAEVPDGDSQTGPPSFIQVRNSEEFFSRFLEAQARTNSWFHERKNQLSPEAFLKLSFEFLTRQLDCFARWYTTGELTVGPGSEDQYGVRIRERADWVMEHGTRFSELAEDPIAAGAFLAALKARIDSRIEYWKAKMIGARRIAALSQRVVDLGSTSHVGSNDDPEATARRVAGIARIRAAFLAANAADPSSARLHQLTVLASTFDLHAQENLKDVTSKKTLAEYRGWLAKVETTSLSDWAEKAPLPEGAAAIIRARVAHWEAEALARVAQAEEASSKGVPNAREKWLFENWGKKYPGRAWSDYEAAKKFELDPHVLEAYRTGRTKKPQPDTVAAIAKGLGVSVENVPK